jgi:hypothetical protein
MGDNVLICQYVNVLMEMCIVIPFRATTRNLTRNPLVFCLGSWNPLALGKKKAPLVAKTAKKTTLIPLLPSLSLWREVFTFRRNVSIGRKLN